MANFQLDPESAINDLLDQIAFIQREKATLQMQLSAVMKQLDDQSKDATAPEEEV